jgi:phospholipase/carboxylesterase
MAPLTRLARPAARDPDGLLVLHHGRGTDEHDLLGLADILDPRRRLHVVSPRAPLTLPGSPGYHWYVVRRVGYPDAESFDAALGALAGLHEELWDETGLAPDRTVFGGFSMGAVMSYAAALGGSRPTVAGVLAFSGFIPVVEGWQPDLGAHGSTRFFVAHGRRDPVIEVGFGRAARELLESNGLEVSYHEGDAGHQIEPAHLAAATAWLDRAIAPTANDGA